MPNAAKHNQKTRARTGARTVLVLAGLLIVLAGMIALVTRSIQSRAPAGEEAERSVESAPAETLEESPEETFTAEPAPTETPALPPHPDVDIGSWELRLVRSDALLPSDYEPPELMEIEDGQLFDLRASTYLQKMISDAREAGYTVYLCSGYRSYDTQYYLYWNHVDEYVEQGMTREEAEAATRVAVNYPGGSEHQLGLAADILEYQGQDMEPYIGGSGLMAWLEEHCADYGFIVRYPEDKTDITGVEYEPWHLRFVGVSAAYIMENGLCLEEYVTLCS